MPFYIDFIPPQSGDKYLRTAAASTAATQIAANENFEIEFEAAVSATGKATIVGSASGARINFLNQTSFIIRTATNVNNTITIPAPSPATAFRVYRVYRNDGANVRLDIDGVFAGSVAYSAAFDFHWLFRDTQGAMQAVQLKYLKFKRSADWLNIWQNSTGTGTEMPDSVGSLQFVQVGTWPSDNSEWVEYGAVSTPISFTGTVPAQSATVGTAFSLNLASYFSGSLTPFAYAVTSGSLPAGLTLSGSTISGTPTAEGNVTGLVVTATDTGSNTAATNAFAINVAAAPALPSGTFTVGTITTTQNTASVPYTYSAADATSIQYRIDAGSPVAATASPQSVTGLTANTGHSIQFRAVNGAGNGDWSAVANFTTQPEASSDGTFTSEPFRRLVDGALMANKTFTYFRLYDNTTGALVVSKTGLVSNSLGVVSFTDPLVVTGTIYKADWRTADGEYCMPAKAAT